MNQREIGRWRKALEETDKLWREATWNSKFGWIVGKPCVLCRLTIRHYDRQCKHCPAYSLPMCCDDYLTEADIKHSRRAIYAAIRKMHRYLDHQEAKNKARRGK